jgi:hypothetical protein
MHETCKNLRNKALAHSEIDLNPARLDPTTGVTASRPFSLVSSRFRVESLVKLLIKVRDACDMKRAAYVLNDHRL